MELLNKYSNGNATIELYNNGEKIRTTQHDKFKVKFPENIDIKITNFCDANCPMCHEDSSLKGKHGKLNYEFLDTLHKGTELAIGGGNALTHPELISFLKRMKEQGIFCNLTVNQIHFMKDIALINKLISQDLIKGLGVSFIKYDEEFINQFIKYENAVLHIINGVIEYEDLQKLFNKNIKLLILGYKNIRRGKTFYNNTVEEKKKVIYNNIHNIIRNFGVVSFDNLAIEQLKIRRIFTKSEWDRFYMGDDGQFTMYIDLPNEKFALSSTSMERYKLKDNIIDMFDVIRKENKK